MMTAEDHIRETENCLEVSEYLAGRGMKLLSSELLWLASKYAVNAVAWQRGLPHGTYQQKETALAAIASGHPFGGLMKHVFELARHKIHPNSDKDFLSDALLDAHCRVVRQFAIAMLAMARAAGS